MTTAHCLRFLFTSALLPVLTCAAVPPDTDADGMSDLWEQAVFNTTDVLAVDPEGNPDRDEFTNLQEYLHGFDPFSPNSTTITAENPDLPGPLMAWGFTARDEGNGPFLSGVQIQVFTRETDPATYLDLERYYTIQFLARGRDFEPDGIESGEWYDTSADNLIGDGTPIIATFDNFLPSAQFFRVKVELREPEPSL
jgi:hypothetical protein